jgi:hypothetical protein
MIAQVLDRRHDRYVDVESGGILWILEIGRAQRASAAKRNDIAL